jgi:hypothetical protein
MNQVSKFITNNTEKEEKMKEQQKSMLVLAMITAFITAGLLLPAIVGARDLEPPAGPDDSGSAMYTIEDIYNYLDTGVAGTKRSSGFTEPTSTLGSTMHTKMRLWTRHLLLTT